MEDSALMRPGRLDRILYVGPPDQTGREEILAIRMRSMTVGPDVDIGRIAELVSDILSIEVELLLILDQTEGCSGAEISSLCQEAAIITMQKDMNAPYASVLIYFRPLNHCLIPRIWIRFLKKPSLRQQKASSVRLRLQCFRNFRNGVMERLLANFEGEESHYPETR